MVKQRGRTADPPLRLGIDIGTREIRVVLFDAQARSLARRASPIRTAKLRETHAAIDFGLVWSDVMELLEQVCVGLPPAVVDTIGVSATASTIAITDVRGAPRGLGLLWTDGGADPIAVEIERTLHTGLRRTLGRMSGDRGLPKFIQLTRERAIGRSDRFVVELSEWVGWRLSGTLVGNTALRQWGWCADDSGRVPDDLLEMLGARDHREMIERPTASTGDAIGGLKSTLGRKIPAIRGASVLAAGMDSYQAALGGGVAMGGRVCASFGHSSSLVLSASGPGPVASMYGPIGSLVPGSDCWHGGQATAGRAVDWATRVLAGTRRELERAATRVPVGAGGLVFRETLRGRRTPQPDPHATGMWHGLVPSHSAGHLYRAVLEAVAMGARLTLEGRPYRELVVAGGLTRSALFTRILADVTGRCVSFLSEAHVAALGAAFADRWADIPSLNPVARTVEPSGSEYEAQYASYRRLQLGGS